MSMSVTAPYRCWRALICGKERSWVWCGSATGVPSSSNFCACWTLGTRPRPAFAWFWPNRFEFTFTPTYGSWLNLIESFFGKMARTLLRGIRVKSKEELKTRIERYLREVNEEPVIFRSKYKLETLSVV